MSLDVLFDEDTAEHVGGVPGDAAVRRGLHRVDRGRRRRSRTRESLESPAPVVGGRAMSPRPTSTGTAAPRSQMTDHDADAEADHAADESATGADPVARWLAGGALVVGVAALIVALVRGRARRS